MYRINEHPILKENSSVDEVFFVFDGEEMKGKQGDTIATALIANGVRSFRVTEKQKSNRGVFCGIGQCSDCLVVVDGVSNIKSCITLLNDGMVIATQKGRGE